MFRLREGSDAAGHPWIECATTPMGFAAAFVIGAIGSAVDLGDEVMNDALRWGFVAPVLALGVIALLLELRDAPRSRLRITVDAKRAVLDVRTREGHFPIDLADLEDVVVETRAPGVSSRPFPRYRRIVFVLRNDERIPATAGHYSYGESGPERFVHRLGQLVAEARRLGAPAVRSSD